MRFLSSLAIALFAATTQACVVGPLNPEQDVSLDVDGQGTLGSAAQASVRASSRSFGMCHTETGELGGYVDCGDDDILTTKIVSVTCTPAEACGPVSFGADTLTKSHTATWTSRQESYRVTVVADGDGIHRAQTVQFTAALPGALFAPAVPALAGTPVELCLKDAVANVGIDVTYAGTALVATPAKSDDRCVTVTPPAKGTLDATARLRDPRRDLARARVTVHDLGEAHTLVIADTSRNDTRALHATKISGKGDKPWFAGVHVTARFDDASSFGFAGAKVVFHDGETVVEATPSKNAGFYVLALAAAPSATAVVTVDAEGRPSSLPVKTTDGLDATGQER